jgi:toxin CptA
MTAILITSLAFLVSFALAAVMGFAIQRGATCTVAAVDEVLSKRTTKRLTSLVEASVWVAGGLLVAQTLGVLPRMPSGYALSGWTLIGSVLLGLGAFVNRACVFGAIARLGSGEWAYALTPVGYWLGCLTVATLFAPPPPAKLAQSSPVLGAPAWVTFAFVAFAAWRLLRPLVRASDGAPAGLISRARHGLRERIWTPHAATTVIGIAFFFMLVLVGAWAYTDLLADLARGMAASLVARTLLLLALLGGAAWGGWTAGRWRATPVTAAQALRCLAGGALMGWGTLLIPGSNDGLILIGMPLLWPYAWVAFATMCVAIGSTQWLLGRRAAALPATP